jgi:hypothetical protein
MTTHEIDTAINTAFYNLAHTNQMVYDFWLSELYDVETNNIIEDKWNEDTVSEMEKDVMFNVLN